MTIPDWLSLAKWRVRPDSWPQGRRLRLLLFADPHVGGPQMPLARLREAVEAANALQPDLIAVMGDYLADHVFVTGKVAMGEVARALAALKAPLGVFAVMGNHDWLADPEAQASGRGPVAYARDLSAAGVRVLENEAVRIGGADGLWVLGLGCQQAFGRMAEPMGVEDLPATLAQVTDESPAILLAHEPDIFPSVPPRVALTVSGHTHGGQINFWGWTPVVPSRFGSRYVYGHIREDGRDLVVSGGLGCSGLPLRFLRRPELTLIELGGEGPH
ncbi:MAG: metallophosphoesterase [Cereibacter sphaeroides]|uniref:Metallophosphoesterase n=1 Tax=Cereibacter sphaeroides TaxID=1063 RepID=A0A2W5UPU0_CERSP|nr:MAG: metallophosphoesterase [Cereibacter sphaeroides]